MRTILFTLSAILLAGNLAFAQDCVECHTKVTPEAVKDWKLSKHFENDVDCTACHGDAHTTNDDYDYVSTPTPATCASCHDTQVEQYSKGKHALA